MTNDEKGIDDEDSLAVSFLVGLSWTMSAAGGRGGEGEGGGELQILRIRSWCHRHLMAKECETGV